MEDSTKCFSGNKHPRTIIGLDGVETQVDVYCVLTAFKVTDPGLQHAVKKLLCCGLRGKGDAVQDRNEAIDAIIASRDYAVQMADAVACAQFVREP